MGNRTAKFVSALVGSLIAGVPLAAVSQNAPNAPSTANAAPDCLASPKGAASQGQHWYYRLDRTTKQKCWYLRAAGDKDGAKVAQAAADTPSDSTAPPPQAVQDARAEFVTPRNGATPKAPNAITPAAPSNPAPPPATQADSSAPQAPAGSPWPDVPAASTAPEPQPAPAMVAAAAQPKAKPSKSPAPPTPAATDGTSDKPGGSLQMLMLVIGGALALAGILASVIYRFARKRVRVHAGDRRGHWDDWTPQDQDEHRAPWQNATLALTPHAQAVPIDFDEVRPPQTAQLAAFTKEIERIAAQSAAVRSEAAELDDDDFFNGTFEIEAAPRLAAETTDTDKPVARDEDHRNEDMRIEDNVDVDVITAMLERLAKQGPRLPQPSPEADLASFARNQRGQSAARA